MTSSDLTKLFRALQIIGKNDKLRAEFVAACRDVESHLQYRDGSVRDDITGPVLDALHSDVGILRKKLSSGLTFDFYYRSKIARDFIMSIPEVPDRVWEPQTTKLLLLLAAHAKHVIIGGAYFGEQAVPVAKEMAPFGGVCHAFEPNLEHSKMLARNAALNELSNLRVLKLGLWHEDHAHLTLAGEDAYASSRSPSEGMREETFETITIDSYLKQQGIDHIDVIMLDIEGGELRALQGASHQLGLREQAPSIVFEVHRNFVDWSRGLQNTEILQYLLSFGYKVFAIRDFQSNFDMRCRPIELIPPDSVYLEGPPHGFNMLAIKDAAKIGSGQFRICRGVSPKLLTHKDPTLHHPTDGLELKKTNERLREN